MFFLGFSSFDIDFFNLVVRGSKFSFQIGSHPNIYVLDTPGVLPPKILDTEVCSKLALTGMIIPTRVFSFHGF